MSDHDQSPGAGGNAEEQPKAEHLNIKVTDNNNEVFFKIKRTTALSKLMNAFCERQGKNLNTVRFLFDGARVNPSDSPDSVSWSFYRAPPSAILSPYFLYKKDLPFGIYANMAKKLRLTSRFCLLAGDGRRRYSRSPPGADRRVRGLNKTIPR